MKKSLVYNVDVEVSTMEASINYVEHLPKTIIDIMQKAHDNNMNIKDYFKFRGLNPLTGIGKIAITIFKGRTDVYELTWSEIQAVLGNNGKLQRKAIIEGVKSVIEKPVNESFISINNQTVKLNANHDLSDIFASAFKMSNHDAHEIEVNGIRVVTSQIENKEISLSISNGTLQHKGVQINPNELDIDEIIEVNELAVIEDAPIVEMIPEGYKFINGEWEYYEYDSNTFDFEIKDHNIEFYDFKNYFGLTICKHTVVRKENFKKGTQHYDLILEEFKDDNSMIINSFMFLEFLKNEPDQVKNLLSQPDSIKQKLFANVDLLRNILLLDVDIKLEFKINIDLVTKIIEKATVNNIPLILSKLPEETRDKLTSSKLIRRIANLDVTWLSPKQLELYENEQKKVEMLEKDYLLTVGEITTLGIREKIKQFDKKKLNKVGGKSTKKWLDANIGHNSGSNSIDEQKLAKAKSILKNFKEIMQSQ